jgi:hypothetical protein
VDQARRGIWDMWLTALAAGVALAGFLLAFFPASVPVNALINRYADPVFWPEGGLTPSILAYRSWVFGVTGAVMGGWGMLMVWVVRGPFRRRERWAWASLALPLACWYLVDTASSLAHGVVSNAILNTGLLVLFAPPLIGSAPTFLRSRT